jgi:hypothetical protein
MRYSPALLLLLTAPAATQTAIQTVIQPAPKVEHALRQRVNEFYKMQVDRKLRESEKLIAPDSRDDYFAGEKPEVLDFQIQSIHWTRNFTEANVTMLSKVHTRRAMAGDQVNTVPYASHWKLVNSKWYWFVPHVNDRETAFGTMHIDQKEIEKHQLDLKKMIQSGPTAQDLMHAVKADRAEVVLKAGSGEPQLVHLTNTLSGAVSLRMVAPQNQSFAVSLSKSQLGPNEEAVVTVIRGIGEPVPGLIGLVVNPVNQNISISVKFEK